MVELLKVGIQSNGIINENILGTELRKLKECGISCIDYTLSIEKVERLQMGVFQELNKQIKKSGIEINQTHAPLYKFRIEDINSIIESLKQSVRACAALESRFMVVHLFNLAHLMGRKKERDLNMKIFSVIGEVAIANNVIICLENVPLRKNGRVYVGVCSTAERTISYIDALNESINKECFGACFDMGHANVLGLDIKREVELLGHRLKVLHIHDNDGVNDTHQLPYTFSNAVNGICSTDWSGFLEGLQTIRYRGVISFEIDRYIFALPGVLHKSMLRFLADLGKNFSNIVLFEEKMKNYRNKKIVLFGYGKMFEVYMKKYGEEYSPIFVVDNNEKLWDTCKEGISIYSPKRINDIKQNERVIIICSAYYEEIIEQLEGMSIFEYELSEEILRMNGKPI